MHWESRRREWEEGAAAVESAITISLLLALVFGIFEFGMALWQSNTMALAVEEAGRYVMVYNTSCNTASCAETQMKNALSSYGGLVTSANSGICQGSPPNLTAHLPAVCAFTPLLLLEPTPKLSRLQRFMPIAISLCRPGCSLGSSPGRLRARLNPHFR